MRRWFRAAHGSGRLYHLGGVRGAASRAAIGIAGRAAPSLLSRRYAWLHEHDVTDGEILDTDAEDAQLLASGLQVDP